jgi:DNA polymerase-3 subunit delta'
MNHSWDVVGQQRAKEILSASMKRRRMSHAYLFQGQAGTGKDAMAIAMVKGLHCQNRVEWGCHQCTACQKISCMEYPEFHFIVPIPSRPKTMKEDKYSEILLEKALFRIANPYQKLDYQPELKTFPVIGIEQIRSLKKKTMLKIPEGQYRMIVISHADKMTLPASNSLLKLLEEPPERTLILLTASARKRILPTIVSRCQVVRFDPLLEKEIEEVLKQRYQVPENKAKFVASISGGSLESAIDLINEKYEEIRDCAFQFLEHSLDVNVFKRVEFCEKIFRERDRTEIQSLFQALLVWLRDILSLRLGEKERLINKDRIGELNHFSEKRAAFDTEKAIRRTEQAIDFIEKNVYLHLIIQGLSADFSRCQNKKGL